MGQVIKKTKIGWYEIWTIVRKDGKQFNAEVNFDNCYPVEVDIGLKTGMMCFSSVERFEKWIKEKI